MHMAEETARVIPTDKGEIIPITEDLYVWQTRIYNYVIK